jgi:UDP-hydrolysing UDP-N-acetyl-D-glucosamine 2-epimerase
MKDKKMLKNKIMVVTTGRADYGLLYPLIKKTIKSELIELQLIATGTHLSSLHGKTIQLIEEDNEIQVTDKVEMTMEKDTEDAICTSIATGLMGFSQLFNRLCPDLLVVLGDRYELWSACMAAVIHKIPIAHIHGGETTFGLIDDSIRHSITKMSAFHFASIDLYAKRIIQMGENPEKVFVVGAIGLDNIKSIPLMSRQELSKHTQIDFKKKIALMTYHPVTLDRYDSAEKQIQEVLNALIKTDLLVLMTMPNSDTSGSVIYQKIKKYSQQYPEKFRLIKNLGQKGYLSAMKYAQLMIGNSSSGIIESASFKLPVVNIGDRQAGRLKSVNIIDCDCSQEAIVKAVNRALLDEFKQSIAHLKSPYGDGNTSTHIVKILESIDLKNKSQFLKKGFYDLKCDLSQINPTRMI